MFNASDIIPMLRLAARADYESARLMLKSAIKKTHQAAFDASDIKTKSAIQKELGVLHALKREFDRQLGKQLKSR